MIERVTAILAEICGAEPEELEPDFGLFEEGLLDSFGIVQLLVELDDAFGVTLDIATLTREEMATPALIAARVAKEMDS